MIIKGTKIDPMPISINGQPPVSMSQSITTHKIVSDEDMEIFHDEMTLGRDILVQVNGKDATYIMVRELVQSKIAMPGKPKDLQL